MPVPERGDLVWMDFSPHTGHEQAGRRPALVLSSREYHRATNFVVVCPITSAVKGYPFEAVLPSGLPVSGAILSDQVKSMDRHGRNLEKIGKVPHGVLEEVQAKIAMLIGITG